MAEIAAAQGEIVCVSAMCIVEVLLDCRELLTEIEANTEQS